MKTIRILIAEDETNLREGLVDTLESEGYRVSAVGDGAAALQVFASGGIDLVLLDIMMPEKSGFDVCREIRKDNTWVPIIMLTAKGEEIDKVLGLELGADDYVTKPFGLHELRARIAAVLRRCLPEPAAVAELSDTINFGAAEIDRKSYQGRLLSRVFNLTARELKLIDAFCRHPGQVLSRNELLNLVWGIDYHGTTRTLDQHIAQLRKKIEIDAASPEVILTVHGVGYRYNH
jgi:two-component system, OmpR family, alkaline phosphatase synthesis response regulator PhoP